LIGIIRAHTGDNVTAPPLRKILEVMGQKNKSCGEPGPQRITEWEEREKSRGERTSLEFIQVSGLQSVILHFVT